MGKIHTTLQPRKLLNHQDLAAMKEGRNVTTPDFDAYWDHSESSVCYEKDGDTYYIGEVYRDHNDSLWTFNAKGVAGENLARGKTPKDAIAAAAHVWENALVELETGSRPATSPLAEIAALYHRWEAQSELDDKDRNMQDHEYLGEIGAILRRSQ